MRIEDIKTIVFDIDGTLVDSNKEIMPKTRQAIIELQNKGIQIIIASGRPVKSMLRLAKELELEKHHGRIISNNGAVAFDTKNMEYIYQTSIPHELVVEILKSLDGRNIWPMVEDGDYMLVKDVYKGTVDFNGNPLNVAQLEASEGPYLLKEVLPIEDNVDHNINKILTIVEPAEIAAVVEEFRDKFGNKLHVVQTSPYFMEFVRPEANKAYGLEKLGIDKDSLMAFGDSMNDMEMLEYAKYPIAMGNSMEPVKKIAYHVTDDNNNEGIYKAFVDLGFIVE